MHVKIVKCLLKALPHCQWWSRPREPAAPKTLLSRISLSCVHIPCPCHTVLPRFTLLLLTSYYFCGLVQTIFFPPTVLLFFILLYISLFFVIALLFLSFAFSPCCSFKKFQSCMAPLLRSARSVPPLLLIASDNAWKTPFSTFIIITSLLSSFWEFILGLWVT